LRPFFISFLCLVCINGGLAQSDGPGPPKAEELIFTGDSLYQIKKYEEGVQQFSQALKIYSDYFKSNADSARCAHYINSALRISGLIGRNAFNDEALEFHQNAIKTGKAILGNDHSLIGKLYLSLSITWHKKAQFDNSEDAVKQALSIFKSGSIISTGDAARCYNVLGSLGRIKGDYDQAVGYYQKIIFLINGTPEPDGLRIAIANMNMANVLKLMGEYDRAFGPYISALKQFKESGIKGYEGICAGNLGELYFLTAKYQKAIKYIKQKEALMLEVHGEKNRNVAESYRALASVYYKLGDLSTALKYNEMSFTRLQELLGPKHQELITDYVFKAELFAAQNKNQEALENIHAAMSIVAPTYNGNDIYGNPSIKQVAVGLEFQDAMITKSNILNNMGEQAVNKTDRLKHYKASLAAITLAAEHVDLMRMDYRDEQTRIFWGENLVPMYETRSFAMYNTTGDQEFLNHAFQFAEKSKATILSEKLAATSASRFGGIPEDLLNEERDIKMAISLTENEVAASLNNDNDKAGKLQDKLFSLKQKRDSILYQFETNYSKYYDLKFNRDIMSIEQVRNELIDDGTLVIEYFVGVHEIFCIAFTSQDIYSSTFEKDDIELLSNQLQESLLKSDPILDPTSAYTSYVSSAFKLYDGLLKGTLKDIDLQQYKNWIIIPDGLIHNIPFEALIAKYPEDQSGIYADLSLLVKDFTISYAYSATVLEQGAKSISHHSNGIQVFAPEYDGGEALQWVRDEVNILRQISGSVIYNSTDATKSNFISTASSAGIIHLAMHGYADFNIPVNSHLLFAPDIENGSKLQAWEIYNMDLNAAMVVLSACETGAGKLIGGGGYYESCACICLCRESVHSHQQMADR